MRRIIAVAAVATSLLAGALAPSYANKPDAQLPAPALDVTSVTATADPAVCAVHFGWPVYEAPRHTTLLGYEFSTSDHALADWADGSLAQLTSDAMDTTRQVDNNGPGYFSIRAVLQAKVKGKPTMTYGDWHAGYGTQGWTC